ncbi:poly A polymerase head domain protein [Ehrlichia chaffeensis str. Heartland]|uniref:PolyA polymerase/tRNA nucleotidyltransferase family protein n=1 Tax=Ehrlichia chaffeensis (strain ATCC CRL-10679 / Arkansas) TaxID=205920 RepID=Q2GF83_EHRCR|nr:CCA tRNA nucleotidyltransferase [Ehrlichia chaffeensis]ABD44597.1 polyA polymerase/tRNA nucleotidyltransferase family protein [Ehrlichia chaffeensis str. Arkansas]AHX03244.1 poly A polymerase head domain protein [Ehrlichia chaffeensis str. Heartland]AHX05160.1 poly A polymerase head domain protein [Ehrlichia chaffeensis str. Jax]AHX07422.1 poly A polymerase head domain protein [Ehrlichia chaffeensis str. Osceola]AHX08169.1 poly A polymerase head domain protein [Ehrlichia chaffeensis str. Sa
MYDDFINNENILLIINAIKKFQGDIRLVGGCVRDSLLKRQTIDIDFATTLLPNQTINALTAAHIKAIPTGIKHGTITALVNNTAYEITTLRSDISCDGRHAEVKFTNNWQQDASRRDFTFNALYCDEKGIVYDYFSGIQDLEKKHLNFIGDPEIRIQEDYLRILRAFRFYASICSQNKLSDEIVHSCTKYSSYINNLSRERIRDEFFKLLLCPNLSNTLKIMQKCHVLDKIIPFEVIPDIMSSETLSNTDPLTKLAALLRTNNNNHSLDKIKASLCLSNYSQKTLVSLLNNNLELPLSTTAQHKHINKLGKEIYCNLLRIIHAELNLNYHDLMQYIEYADQLIIPEFPISGKDLLNIGYQPGKNLGITLEKIKDLWENSSYQLTKTQLLDYARGKLLKSKN